MLPFLIALVAIQPAPKPSPYEIYEKPNLVAWCVVPFDAASAPTGRSIVVAIFRSFRLCGTTRGATAPGRRPGERRASDDAHGVPSSRGRHAIVRAPRVPPRASMVQWYAARRLGDRSRPPACPIRTLPSAIRRRSDR